MKLHASALPCPEAEFLQKLDAYRASRDAHKLTVGVPAPFPEFEILRTIVDQGVDNLVIVRDELQEQAQAASRNALAELDALKAKVVELEALKEKVAQIDVLSAKVTSIEGQVGGIAVK